jgi:hypothetical protein
MKHHSTIEPTRKLKNRALKFYPKADMSSLRPVFASVDKVTQAWGMQRIPTRPIDHEKQALSTSEASYRR